MADLHYSIHIDAAREKVWNTMLDDTTYRQWTEAFMPGSYYVGDWSEGSTMSFIGPDEGEVKGGGMIAEVKENRAYEFLSLQYRAEIRDGVEIPWETVGFENYSLQDSNGGTEVVIDLLGLPDEYAGMFDDSWPKALQKLKELAEK